jgi:hypothetical protein
MVSGLLLILGLAVSLEAQDVAGGLRGRVVGPDSVPLSQANVEVISPSLPQPVTVGVDPRGLFHLLSLPVGNYVVRLRAVGYRALRVEEVFVALGGTTDLGVIVLEAQTIELSELIVRAGATSIDATSTATGMTMRAEEFDALPLDRSYRSILALAPQANSQLANVGPGGSDGVNVGGGSVWDNAYFVDGVDVTDPFVARAGTNLPYNFLKAVEVKTGGYEAEYGRSLGGVVNMVTPSGGNHFEGEAFTFVSDHRLRTGARYGSAEPNLDSYTQFDVGLSLSGPLRRDRLWYYAAYNPLIDHRTASYRGMSPADDRRVQHRFAGKLTWQPKPATRLALTVTGDPVHYTAVTGLGPNDAVANPEVALATLRQGGGNLSLRWTQLVGSRLQLGATGARSLFRDDFTPRTALGLTAPQVFDVETGVYSGGTGGYSRLRVARNAIGTSGTLLAASHIIKLGLEYEGTTLDARSEQGRESIGGYITRFSDSVFVWHRLVGRAEVSNRVYTVYAQDSWEVSRRVRLNLGLRWEQQDWRDGGRNRQTIGGEWAPRLGIVVSPGAPGTQKVTVSAGRFYTQTPLNALSVFYGKGYFTGDFYPQDPQVDTSGRFRFAQMFGGARRVDGLRGQYHDELTLGYERAIGQGFKVGVHGTYRVLRSVIEDTQIFGDTDVVGNPGRGRMKDFPDPDHHYSAVELTFERSGVGRLSWLVSYVLSRNTGNYLGLYGFDGQNPNSSSQFDVHDSLVISTGLLPNDRTHVLKVIGAYRTRFGLTVGLSGSWTSGVPRNRLGSNGSYLTFLKPRGTDGRTPSLWDLNLRLDQQLPVLSLRGAATRFVADLEHVGSPRRAVAVDEQYSDDHLKLNPRFGAVTVYQPPMSLRIGVVMGF